MHVSSFHRYLLRESSSENESNTLKTSQDSILYLCHMSYCRVCCVLMVSLKPQPRFCCRTGHGMTITLQKQSEASLYNHVCMCIYTHINMYIYI